MRGGRGGPKARVRVPGTPQQALALRLRGVPDLPKITELGFEPGPLLGRDPEGVAEAFLSEPPSSGACEPLSSAAGPYHRTSKRGGTVRPEATDPYGCFWLQLSGPKETPGC